MLGLSSHRIPGNPNILQGLLGFCLVPGKDPTKQSTQNIYFSAEHPMEPPLTLTHHMVIIAVADRRHLCGFSLVLHVQNKYKD